jgi:hypothetical protein
MQKAVVVMAFYLLSCQRVIRAIVAFPEFPVGFIVYFFDLGKVFSDYFGWWVNPRIFGHGGMILNGMTPIDIFLMAIIGLQDRTILHNY